MGELDATKKIKIISVEKSDIQINGLYGVRVQHEYTIVGDTTQSFTQLSLFFVHFGRGYSVTVVGRTELFQELSEEIQQMIDGIQWRSEN